MQGWQSQATLAATALTGAGQLAAAGTMLGTCNRASKAPSDSTRPGDRQCRHHGAQQQATKAASDSAKQAASSAATISAATTAQQQPPRR